MKFLKFTQLLYTQVVFWLLAVATSFIARLVLLHWFTASSVKAQFSHDVYRVLLKGLQFDIKTASILVALPFLLSLISMLNQKLWHCYQKIQPLLLTLLMVLLVGTTIGNIFYFKVYGHQFDVFVFGVAEEDPLAVLMTIWHDFPVVSGLIVLLILAWLFYRLFQYCSHRKYDFALPSSVSFRHWAAIVLTPLLLIAIGIRGSLGTFPLRQDAAQISTSPHLNKLTANAIISLDWARKEHANSQQFGHASDSDGIKLISILTQKPTQSADLNQLIQHTPYNPAVEAKQPNVVLAVMESMSAHLMQLQSSQRDVMGALQEPFTHDWTFHRFISEGDGTSDTLHRLFIRSPYLNLSQSSAKNSTFISNVFTPYLKAGYDIVYITAGNGGWRDFDSFLHHLGVNEFIDENTLKQRYPEAAQQATTWGTPDKYMFHYASERLDLAEKTGKPVMIMLLSITNHPPYQLPQGEKHIDYQLSKDEQNRLSDLAQGKELNEILNTFHYSNDQLGQFIQYTKQHDPHTIIAATGDHNMRAIGYPETSEIARGHAVPFYLFVPEAYRHNAVYQPERVGSHKDIMPTLYSLSLSNAPYYQTGCNLIDKNMQDNPWCGYGYNPEVLILPEGFYHLANHHFYRWEHPDQLIAQAVSSTIPPTDKLPIQKGSAYTEFLKWQINRAIQDNRHNHHS